MKTIYRLSVLAILVFTGCGWGGNTRVNREAVDTINIGRTTQRDVVKMFGYPESIDPNAGRPMLILNQTELANYLYRQTLRKYEDIPDGKYEAWTYFSAFGHSTGIGRSDHLMNVMIIFNERGIVYKKFFSDVDHYTFQPFSRRLFFSPEYEELN